MEARQFRPTGQARLPRLRRILVPRALIVAALLGGCKPIPLACNSACVSGQIEMRTGYPTTDGPACVDHLCGQVASGESLGEDEAVLIALWRNAAFRTLLSDLDISRADLVDAGLLPNPDITYFFSVPGKAYKYAAQLPVEVFWLRPIRVKAAGKENERTCERLIQAGLDLIRDTRQAHADLVLARARLRVAEDTVKLRDRILGLAESRVRAGDASELEAATARIDALRARQEAIRIAAEVPVAEQRLRNLLGLGELPGTLIPAERPVDLSPDPDADALTAEAVRSRPDVLAALSAEEAAWHRLRLARIGWWTFLGILDATSGQDTGHEFGPAFQVKLPLFNLNQGGRSRARAELERAGRDRERVHDQVILEVRQAHARYRQARAEMIFQREKTRPEVESAIRRAEKAYREGNASYLIVLETSRQLIDTALREAQLEAELRRAWADLERNAGRRLDVPPPPEPRDLPEPESVTDWSGFKAFREPAGEDAAHPLCVIRLKPRVSSPGLRRESAYTGERSSGGP